MLDDIRYALRGMTRTPGFTATALLMIALGTGANAAMFSVIDAVLLRSPFIDPERLAIVLVGTPGHTSAAVSIEQYRALQASPVFQAVGAMGSGQRPVVTGIGEPRRMNVECITEGTFRALGTAPIAGRTFSADEDRPGGPGAVVISYQFWRRELNGAPDAVGRAITIGGVPATIVGIMPRAFGGPYARTNNDGWLPLGQAIGGVSPGCNARGDVNVFARLQPDIPIEAAAAQATASAGIDRIPDWEGRLGTHVSLISLERQTVSELRTPMYALLGAVGLVLVIACANVANLQMERIAGRRRELAVRAAIGASRARLVRHTLTESLLLSVLGCAAGLAAARWTLGAIVALLPANVPRVDEIAIGGRILAATFGASLVAGLAAGLMPALQAGAPSLADDLRASAGSTPGRGTWARGALVAVQIALSLTLVIGATLMLRTFLTLRPSDPGFRATDKLTAVIRLQGAHASDPAAFFGRLLDRIRAIPGVEGAAGSTYLPMSGTTASANVIAGGVTIDVWTAAFVTPEYFGEMAIPVTRGRSFDDRDTANALPVAIVNEAFARRAWPSGNPIGTTVEVARAGTRTIREVVGVVGDTRTMAGNLNVRPEVYVPFAQSPGPLLNLIVRARRPGDPALAGAIRGAAAALDRTQVVDRVAPYQDFLDSRVARWRFGAWLLGVFAGMSILLASVGLTSAIAWWVASRTREIGVRMALGAHPAQVTGMFLRQGLALAAAGVAAGLAGAAASTRFLQGWLYGVTPLNPAAFAGSAVALLAIAALASYVPARRAARVDPLVALRAE